MSHMPLFDAQNTDSYPSKSKSMVLQLTTVQIRVRTRSESSFKGFQKTENE